MRITYVIVTVTINTHSAKNTASVESAIEEVLLVPEHPYLAVVYVEPPYA